MLVPVTGRFRLRDCSRLCIADSDPPNPRRVSDFLDIHSSVERLTIKQYSKSSSICASCTSRVIRFNGVGSLFNGKPPECGGNEILEASGAVDGAVKMASGFHGSIMFPND